MPSRHVFVAGMQVIVTDGSEGHTQYLKNGCTATIKTDSRGDAFWFVCADNVDDVIVDGCQRGGFCVYRHQASKHLVPINGNNYNKAIITYDFEEMQKRKEKYTSDSKTLL